MGVITKRMVIHIIYSVHTLMSRLDLHYDTILAINLGTNHIHSFFNSVRMTIYTRVIRIYCSSTFYNILHLIFVNTNDLKSI